MTTATTVNPHEEIADSISVSRDHRLVRRHAVLRLLADHMREGRIRFIVGDDAIVLGPGRPGERNVTVRVYRERMFRAIAAAGNLGLGEAYMDGDFEVETGTLEDFVAILLRNRLDEAIKTDPVVLLRVLLQRAQAGARVVRIGSAA